MKEISVLAVIGLIVALIGLFLYGLLRRNRKPPDTDRAYSDWDD
jgi:LPXTG-motif cell wall-anchored protein